jgi:hypothetical protein
MYPICCIRSVSLCICTRPFPCTYEDSLAAKAMRIRRCCLHVPLLQISIGWSSSPRDAESFEDFDDFDNDDDGATTRWAETSRKCR